MRSCVEERGWSCFEKGIRFRGFCFCIILEISSLINCGPKEEREAKEDMEKAG